MNYKISFKERAEMAKQILSAQLPATLTDAKKHVITTKELRHLDVGEYRTNKAGSVAGDE